MRARTTRASFAANSALHDRAHRFAGEAVQHWMERLRRISGDERAVSHLIVDRQQFGWLVDELAAGADRLRIAHGLAKDVRVVENNANAK